jgi:hypothetical protein
VLYTVSLSRTQTIYKRSYTSYRGSLYTRNGRGKRMSSSLYISSTLSADLLAGSRRRVLSPLLVRDSSVNASKRKEKGRVIPVRLTTPRIIFGWASSPVNISPPFTMQPVSSLLKVSRYCIQMKWRVFSWASSHIVRTDRRQAQQQERVARKKRIKRGKLFTSAEEFGRKVWNDTLPPCCCCW